MSGPEDASERRFIERLRSHDERAFNELVEAYGDRVYGLLFRMLAKSDEAEDLTQEVFVQVFKTVGTFRGEARLGTWIYRVAVNICKNHTKYLARRQVSHQDELDAAAERGALGDAKGVTSGESAQPDQLVEGFQLEAIIKRCIAGLDPDFREVLVLRDVEDLTYEEIQEIIGIGEGTLKSRLHRARAMLREAIERATGEKMR